MKTPDLFGAVRHKRILITGGTGFIGSWLAEFLAGQNDVTLFDNGRRNALQYIPEKLRKNVTLISGDIRDVSAVKKAVKGKEIIFHLAAIAGASSYEKDPLLTLQVNLLGTENLLRSVADQPVSQVILFSSSEVYGTNAHGVSEKDITPVGSLYEGRWSYAISKLASDHLALAYYKRMQVPVTIVRPFNIYGPRQVGEGAVVNMIQTLMKEKTVYVSGDGSQKRSWCYITDFLKAIELMVKKKTIGECYNIGNPNAYVKIGELAGELAAIVGNGKLSYRKKTAVDIEDRLPSIAKARKELGFNPSVSLQEGLVKTYEWFKNYRKTN